MSLLIKALDKAQDAKVKQVQAEKDKNEAAQELAKLDLAKTSQRAKAAKVEPTTATELTLSPPEHSLLEAPLLESTGYTSDLIPSSILESAAAKQQKEVAAKLMEKPAQKPSYKPITSAATTNKSVNQASAPSSQTGSQTPAQAANVFSAKRIEATHQNAKLAIIAGSALIALLAMGAYFYQFVDTSPELPMPAPRPAQIAVAQPIPEPAPLVADVAAAPEVNIVTPANPPAPEVKMSSAPDTTQAFEAREVISDLAAKASKKQKIKAAPPQDDEEPIKDTVEVENTLAQNEVVASPSKKAGKSNMVKMDKAIASESASIQVTQSKPQDAVSPLVMRAYEAYNAGRDSDAQKLYKQALQRDSLNVDAMLGLAAIASRQGRADDAGGWYRKVLALEPKNSTAQAAMLELQQQENPQAGESHIKSMIAKTPNDANLYAALGNLYAEQNQWPAAQQAYFDAFRLNGNADNAFNLAVSLDQMGKSKLALPYYQQALQLAQLSVSGVDKAALQARIAAIQ